MRPPISFRGFLIGAGLAALPWTSAPGQALEPSAVCGTPMMCIEALHGGLINLSLAEEAGNLTERAERLEPLIAATHDLHYIAEFTIRRHWASLSDEEAAAFVQTFRRLSVMTYASRFVAVSGDTFDIQESRLLDSGRMDEPGYSQFQGPFALLPARLACWQSSRRLRHP